MRLNLLHMQFQVMIIEDENMSSVTNIIFLSPVLLDDEIQEFINCLNPITNGTKPFVHHKDSGGSKVIESEIFTAGINYIKDGVIDDAIKNLKDRFDELDFEDMQIALKGAHQERYELYLLSEFNQNNWMCSL